MLHTSLTHCLFLISLLLPLALPAGAQTRFAFDDVYHCVDTSRSDGDLLLRVSDVNFFKNDEYFNDYIEGYTLIGYRIAPSLVYYLRNNVSVEAGAQFLQYGGTDKYDHVFPFASVQWQINRTWNITMGSLNGHIAHGLPEPMWEPERQLTDKPETGLQVKVRRPHLNGEVWLNWQQFIKTNDTIPEKFTFGLALDVSPTATDASWSLSIPVRLLVSHVGGQISNYSQRMQSLANGSLSILFGHLWHNSFAQHLYVDIEGQFFHAMVDGDVRPFSDGHALYPKLCFDARLFSAHAGFWYAKNFFSLYGNPAFMSLSNYNDDVYSKKRQLLTFGADFNYALSSCIRFSIGGKAYFDTAASQFDYSYQAHLVVTPQWRLTNAKLNLNNAR